MGHTQTINLLPPKKRKAKAQLSIGIKVGMVLLLLVGLIGTQWIVTLNWKTETDLSNQSVTELNSTIRNLKEHGVLKAQLSAYNEASQFIAEIEKSRVDWLPYINAIVEPLSLKALIKQVEADEAGELTIDIEFPTPLSLVEYMLELEQDSRLKDVKLNTTYSSVDDESTGSEDTKKRNESYKLKLVISMGPVGGEQP